MVMETKVFDGAGLHRTDGVFAAVAYWIRASLEADR